MDRTREIKNFIDYLVQLSKENPSLDINQSFVYSNIVLQNCERTPKHSNGKNFNSWINHFKNNKNINVFNPDYWQYFCLFKSTNARRDTNEYIKLYLPLNEQYMEKGATELFDFLAKNNIYHNSKIGKDHRVDSIVLRINDEKDLEKIEEFVANNNAMQKGLIKPNPFLINNGSFAMAYDGQLSFNSELSYYLSNYVNGIKNKSIKSTGNNYNDFYNYLDSLYEEVFIHGKLDNYYKDKFDEYDEEDIKINNLLDCKNILKLILLSSNPNSNKQTFLNAHKQVNSDTNRKIDYSIIELQLNRIKVKQKVEEKSSTNIENINISDKLSTLENAIISTYNKYGINQVVYALKEYVITKNPRCFTNDNQARTMLINTITPEEVSTIVGPCINDEDIINYLHTVFPEMKIK